MRRHSILAASLAALALGFPGGPASALPDVTLWVVQPPGEVVAFEVSDFTRVGGVRIPREAFVDPDRLRINGAGQIFVPTDAGALWIWDGAAARTVTPPKARPAIAPDSVLARSGYQQWLLGDDRRTLYVLDAVSYARGREASDTSGYGFTIREVDLQGRTRRTLTEGINAYCEQREYLGLMAFTCPDPELWTPGNVARDFFVLSRCEPAPRVDEFAAALCSHQLWSRASGEWRASDMGASGYLPVLDIVSGGASWLQAERDGGCCGWANVGSERLLWHLGDSTIAVFDEWSRFRNENYDVSFFASDARVSPDGERVACTIRATNSAGESLRVSSEGHADSVASVSIRELLARLPSVEIYGNRGDTSPILVLERAEMVGWASASEVLVVERGRLVGVRVTDGTRRPSGIGVRSAADARLVWR